MSVVVEFRQSRGAFLLGALPDSWEGRVSFEQVVPVAEEFLPSVRVTGDDEAIAACERAVRSSPDVTALDRVERTDGFATYRVSWTGETVERFRAVLGDAVLLEATATDAWHVHLRFPDHDSVTAFRTRARDRGMRAEVLRVRTVPEDSQTSLTPIQRRTLVVAVDRGYFEVPRQATLDDLAADLGVSKQAVSERLRRALGSVAADAVRGSESLSRRL